jgi:hypothetical protein
MAVASHGASMRSAVRRVLVIALAVAYRPLGDYMYRVYTGTRHSRVEHGTPARSARFRVHRRPSPDHANRYPGVIDSAALIT